MNTKKETVRRHNSPKNITCQVGKFVIDLKEPERQRVECWSRVMGYHRPISHFNVGKKQEFSERKYFKEPVEGDSGKKD